MTMVEVTISVALFGALALGIMQFASKTERQLDSFNENISDTIARLGGSKVMINDLAVALPSFGHLHLLDDTGKPFFSYSRSELCLPAGGEPERCKRKITMTIPRGQVRSKPFFLIINKGLPLEQLRTQASPRAMIVGGEFQAFNPHAANPDLTIAKTPARPESAWDKGRLIMVSSLNAFFDCAAMAHGGGGATCATKCTTPGTCNHATERPLAMLGVVSATTRDLAPVTVRMHADLLKTSYRLCQRESCTSSTVQSIEATSTKELIEKLPYLPGLNNNVTFAPVQVIRYHLERPSADAPPHKNLLMRSTSTIVGNQISFDRAQILGSGVQAIDFTRENISYPNLEFKLQLARKDSN